LATDDRVSSVNELESAPAFPTDLIPELLQYDATDTATTDAGYWYLKDTAYRSDFHGWENAMDVM